MSRKISVDSISGFHYFYYLNIHGHRFMSVLYFKMAAERQHSAIEQQLVSKSSRVPSLCFYTLDNPAVDVTETTPIFIIDRCLLRWQRHRWSSCIRGSDGPISSLSGLSGASHWANGLWLRANVIFMRVKMKHLIHSSLRVISSLYLRPHNYETLTSNENKEHPLSNMSLSKGQLSVSASEPPRQPKCTRCRHHGVLVPQKGHTKCCPFLRCDCYKCSLITQKTRLTALQRRLKKDPTQPQRREHRPTVEDGALEWAAVGRRDRQDTRRRALARWHRAAEGDGGKVVPFSSREEGPGTRFNVPYFGDLGQAAPLPVFHVPWMSGYPSGYGPCPSLLPWLPPVPTGLYNNGLRGPLMFPHFQPAALHYPPPPEPGPAADCRPVFFTLRPLPLPEPPQEEPMSWQHPLSPPPKHTEPDVEELD